MNTDTPTTPPPPFHTTEAETFIPYRITYGPGDEGTWIASIPALNCHGRGATKHEARALALEMSVQALFQKPLEDYPPSDFEGVPPPAAAQECSKCHSVLVGDEKGVCMGCAEAPGNPELAPMAADPALNEARRIATLEVLKVLFPEMSDEERLQRFDSLRAELQGAVNHQARLQAAASKQTRTGTKVRLPVGATMQIFGGMFRISTVGKRGFTATAMAGTTVDPRPLAK